jgi:2'-5' RNA ligase
MRLFTGLSIPSHIEAALERVLAELRPMAAVRWSRPENFHITSKFIGEWPALRLAELQAELAALDAPVPFKIQVTRFGFLPNPHRPKIFFAGVRGEVGLSELAARTDAALFSLGVKREERPYTPHLTLARIGNEAIGSLRERIASSPAPEFGAFTAESFHLYASSQSAGGSVYSIVGSYPLPKVAS